MRLSALNRRRACVQTLSADRLNGGWRQGAGRGREGVLRNVIVFIDTNFTVLILNSFPFFIRKAL